MSKLNILGDADRLAYITETALRCLRGAGGPVAANGVVVSASHVRASTSHAAGDAAASPSIPMEIAWNLTQALAAIESEATALRTECDQLRWRIARLEKWIDV